MTKFADQLFEDLMTEHGASLAAARGSGVTSPARGRTRIRRPVRAAAGTLAAAVTAAVGIAVFSGGGAAYAVTDNHDGTVTISLKEMSGVGGANGELHSLGVPVVVAPVGTAAAGCTAVESIAVPPADHAKVTLRATAGPNGSVTVDVHGVPAGDEALVTFQTSADGRITGSMFLVRAGSAPACVVLPTPPAGGPTTSTGGGVRTHVEGPTDAGAGPVTAEG